MKRTRRDYSLKQKEVKPCPEAVAKGHWTIRVPQEQQTDVDLPDKVLTLPVDQSVISQSMRNQVYTTLAVDQKNLYPRINRYTETDEEQAWGRTLQSVYLNEFAKSKEVDISGLPVNTIIAPTETKRAMQYIELASLDATDQMKQILKAMTKPQNLIDACASTVSRLAQLGRTGKKINPDALQEIVERLKTLFPADKGEGFPRPSPGESTLAMETAGTEKVEGWGDWGAMEIVELPLTKQHDSARIKKKSRASLIGAFKLPHRANLLTSDGRCFIIRRKKEGGGSVLIDGSGSMNWSSADLAELLNHAPTTIIAVYGSLPENCDSGRLAIVAQGGKIADLQGKSGLRDVIGEGNVVDGPALKWLAEQSEPRFWVTDGGVTGVDDHSTRKLVNDAEDIRKRNKITRVGDLPAALTLFERYKRKKVR